MKNTAADAAVSIAFRHDFERRSVSRAGGRALALILILTALLAPITRAATIVVNSAADPAGFNPIITIPQLGATITLRDAVNAVNYSGGTHIITFAPGLAGQTIYLSQSAGSGVALSPHQVGLPAKNLTIQGLTGNNGVTIARNPNGPTMGLFLCLGSDLTLTLNDLTFSGGDVTQSNGWGGAFNIIGTSVTMNRCTLTGNKASLGAAIYTRDSTLNVTNCTIAGNNANDSGGGIYHYVGGAVTFTHTTIANNNAGRGGGLFNYSGGDLLVNTIVAGNHAYLFGHDLDGNGGAGVSSSSHHNLIGDAGSSGGLSNGVNGNIVGANALLNSLANNGGPGPTVALSAGSPALNVAAPGAVIADQRGVSRPQGAGVDMGAYELVDGAPTTFTNPNSTTFVIGFNNNLNVTANGAPSPAFSASGALPDGVTLTPAGLFSGNPGIGTEGTYPLTITASNNAGMTTQSFTLTVIHGVVVTTGTDEDNGSPNPALGTGTSLREAINYAATLPGPQTIIFAPNLAGQTIDLTVTGSNVNGPSALRIDTDITIQGLSGNSGITIRRATGGTLRPFLVSFDATLTLNDLTIADGLAQQGGGIYNFGTLKMNRCTLRNNTATFRGGGLASGGGGINGQRATLINCTLANNQTQFTGGGLANDSSSILNLINVTVAGNTSTNANAGMDVGGTVVAINTMVAGNTGPSGASDVGGGFNASSHHNLIGTGGSGGLVNGANGNIVGVQNPRLGALALNGGPTQTMALQGSPAFNAGATVADVTTDQRGVVRPQNGRPDIGAYEYNGAVNESLVVTTTADELNLTSDPGFGAGTSLREALYYAEIHPGPDTITFAPGLEGTITMGEQWANASTSSVMEVFNQDVIIQGPTTGAGITIAVAPGTERRHIYVYPGSSLTIANLTLTGGSGDYGGSLRSAGTLTMRGCTFTGNSASYDGGAVHAGADSPALVVENCTFAGNSSGTLSSAIATGALQTDLRHLTVTNNTAPDGSGGAILLYQYPATMVNTIVAGNTNDGIILLNEATFTAQTTNNILGSGGSGGLVNGVNGNLVGVPLPRLYLGALAQNGGPTPTVALLSGSPAINSGVAISGLSTDQRGLVRSVGMAPDIGAVEDATGDDDPDHDSLSNLDELALGTNPLALDSDNDGFNDATEIMADSDANSSASVPPTTHLERVVGFGPARGLDLTGNFRYAFNVGTPGAVGMVGDAFFGADNAPGITVSATSEVTHWSDCDLGNSPADNLLETVYRSIRWSNHLVGDPEQQKLKVDLANLVPGRKYKLQLLFAESGSTGRRFDVSVEGAVIVDDFSTSDAQGAQFATRAASAIVHEFVAGDSTLNIALDGTNVAAVPFLNQDPILNGVTLEVLPTTLETWRTLHALPADGVLDLANPSGDGVSNLLKYAFNMAANVGDLAKPNVGVLPENGTAGLPFIARDAQGRLFIEFVRRKAATNPGIVYVVETGDALTSLTPLDLGSATVVPIDATWERVTAADPTITPNRFGHVRVNALP